MFDEHLPELALVHEDDEDKKDKGQYAVVAKQVLRHNIEIFSFRKFAIVIQDHVE
jgi:hypothetical protein